MKLERWNVRNVKRIVDVEIPADGRHLILVGGHNGQGKSSAIDALVMTVCGKRKTDWPDVPIRDGEDEAEVRLVLTDVPADLGIDTKTLTVVRRWERQRGKVVDSLRILDETGDESATPQQLLDGLFRNRSLDPMSMEQLSKEERRRLLMDAVGLTDVYADSLAKEKTAYDQRQDVNRTGRDMKALYDRMDFHADAPAEEVVVSDLLHELTEAQSHNAAVQSHEQRVVQVEQMRKRLAEMEERLQEEQPESLAVIDVDAIRQRITNAESLNRKLSENRDRSNLGEKLVSYRERSAELTKEIETQRKRREDAIAAADWPVEGLSVDSEGLLLNGIPVEQCATSERIKLWAKLSSSMNPELRLLVIKNGNDLDNDSLAALDQFLKESDFQAIVEYVVRSDADCERCVVVIEDGSVKGGS